MDIVGHTTEKLINHATVLYLETRSFLPPRISGIYLISTIIRSF